MLRRVFKAKSRTENQERKSAKSCKNCIREHKTLIDLSRCSKGAHTKDNEVYYKRIWKERTRAERSWSSSGDWWRTLVSTTLSISWPSESEHPRHTKCATIIGNKCGICQKGWPFRMWWQCNDQQWSDLFFCSSLSPEGKSPQTLLMEQQVQMLPCSWCSIMACGLFHTPFSLSIHQTWH